MLLVAGERAAAPEMRRSAAGAYPYPLHLDCHVEYRQPQHEGRRQRAPAAPGDLEPHAFLADVEHVGRDAVDQPGNRGTSLRADRRIGRPSARARVTANSSPARSIGRTR